MRSHAPAFWSTLNGIWQTMAIGRSESDIMSLRMTDQPETVLSVLRTQLRTGEVTPARDILARQAEGRQEALAEIQRRFGWRRHRLAVFRWWHRRLTRFSVLREANRHHLMYYSLAVRRLFAATQGTHGGNEVC